MAKYKTVVICVDDTERDEPMLSYMTPLLQIAGTETVYLLHVHDPDTDPHTTSVIPSNGFAVEIPVTPLSDFTEKTRDNMQKLAKQYLCNQKRLNHRIVLSSSPNTTEILKQAAKLNADLIVIGRHYGDHIFDSKHAVIARRITRKATCTVLILPENTPARVSKIFVPVRDSNCSSMALATACELACAYGAKVAAVNIYRPGSSKQTDAIADYQIATNSKRSAALAENKKLLKRTPLSSISVTNICVPSSAQGPAETMLETIIRNDSDMIVIGARGRTGAASVLLGAITEQLIQDSPVPVMAVKRKGECLDMLHALISLMKK